MLHIFRGIRARLMKRSRAFRFTPILAGATVRERLLACVGALFGILLTSLICGALYGGSIDLPLVVAPIGASAVLLFAVPTSPLAQPWPIIGGNVISAIVGVACAQFITDTSVAAAVAVSAAILVMSFTRCLHPPGGATALTAVVTDSGYLFPLLPIGLNSVLLVCVGIAFHAMARRNYPHVAAPLLSNTHGTLDPPAPERVGFKSGDIAAALGLLDETFDIEPSDLERLLRQVEQQALERTHAETLCKDIMSRDVIAVNADSSPLLARTLLLKHNLRTLPVIDADNKVVGTVGLRELADNQHRIDDIMSRAITAREDQPAVALVPALADGRTHAVIVVDGARQIRGVITQTDLLALLARKLNDTTAGRQPGDPWRRAQ